MKLFLKKLFLIFISATLFVSMFATIGLYSQLHEVKVVDTSTGQIVFEEEAGNLGDFADALISDNDSFAMLDDKSFTSSSTAPQSPLKLKSANLYLVSQSTTIFPSPQKCIMTIEFEDGYDYNLIIQTRGRGS